MSTKADVVRYVEEHAGQTVYINDILKDLNFDDSRRNYVQGVMRKLADAGDVKTKVNAEVWICGRYSNGHTLYERITVSKTGVWVMQDEDGNISLVREIQ